jgi:hypothetical protein
MSYSNGVRNVGEGVEQSGFGHDAVVVVAEAKEHQRRTALADQPGAAFPGGIIGVIAGVE